VAEEQKQGVLTRDYNRMIAAGGNIYFLSKLFSSDGQSFEFAASSMTGMAAPDYREMMLSGGRQVEGNRYLSELKDGKLRTNATVEKK
jgi:protocatechuate 4,5-dioxygenase alpha chain